MRKPLRRSKSLVPFHRSSDKKSRHRRRRLQSGLEPLNAQRREEGVATRLRNKKYAKKLGRGGGGFGSTGNHDNIRLIVVRRARKERGKERKPKQLQQMKQTSFP